MAPGREERAAISRSGVKPIKSQDNEGFATNKKDKRTIKHSAFVSRIEKTSSRVKKRRRASKKLVANLESLADALPTEGSTEDAFESAHAKIRHRSLKSRPGAMKRKEKLEKMERERFGKNMAQMIGGTTASPSEITNGAETATKEKSDGSSTRWAALRGFIQQTMEQKPEFKVA